MIFDLSLYIPVRLLSFSVIYILFFVPDSMQRFSRSGMFGGFAHVDVFRQQFEKFVSFFFFVDSSCLSCLFWSSYGFLSVCSTSPPSVPYRLL